MPLSYGSIGKIYTDVVSNVVFTQFLGVYTTLSHTSSFQQLSQNVFPISFLINDKLIKINKEEVCYGIEGVTAQFAIPKSQVVRLYEQTTGQFITEQRSSVNGEFLFLYLDPNKKYTLTMKDEDGILESVIIDSISPKIFTQ